MKLQEMLDKLQPYLLGIRYLEGIPLLDVVLKEGWIIPDEKDINKLKGGDDSVNYYMVFSENKTKSLDELLDYVDGVIKLNQEREEKNQLLRVKVNELKEFFKVHTLAKLNKLKFTIEDVPEAQDYDEFDLNIDEVSPVIEEKVVEVPINTYTGPTLDDVPFTIETDDSIISRPYLDENGFPIEMTEEEKEILAEEERGLRNIKTQRTRKATSAITKPKIIINQHDRDY